METRSQGLHAYPSFVWCGQGAEMGRDHSEGGWGWAGINLYLRSSLQLNHDRCLFCIIYTAIRWPIHVAPCVSNHSHSPLRSSSLSRCGRDVQGTDDLRHRVGANLKRGGWEFLDVGNLDTNIIILVKSDVLEMSMLCDFVQVCSLNRLIKCYK